MLISLLTIPVSYFFNLNIFNESWFIFASLEIQPELLSSFFVGCLVGWWGFFLFIFVCFLLFPPAAIKDLVGVVFLSLSSMDRNGNNCHGLLVTLLITRRGRRNLHQSLRGVAYPISIEVKRSNNFISV